MSVFFALLRNPAVLLVLAMLGLLVIYYNRLIKAREHLELAWQPLLDLLLRQKNKLLTDLLLHAETGPQDQQLQDLIARLEAMEQAEPEAFIREEMEIRRQLDELPDSIRIVADSEAGKKETEQRITELRNHYNQEVIRYNTMLESFPIGVLAGLLNFDKRSLLI